MTYSESAVGRTWRYRFSRPDEVEIEVREFDGDESAETHAQDLSKTQSTPIKIWRHNSVDWEYLTEVDERR